MKKYKKYKDFIPYSFYLRTKENEKKYEKRLMTVVLIFNLLFTSLNINSINKLAKKNVEPQEEKSYIDKEGFRLETINAVVNKLFSDDFEEVRIENGSGEILVDTLECVDNLKDSAVINIKEARRDENNKYKIGVDINEK